MATIAGIVISYKVAFGATSALATLGTAFSVLACQGTKAWRIRKARRDARKGRVIMCLPRGQDKYGQTLHVEVLEFGIKERYSAVDFLNAVPVTIDHMPDGMRVTWGSRDTLTFARLGRSFLPAHAAEEPLFAIGDQKLWSAPAPECAPAPADATAGESPKKEPRLEAYIPGSLYDPFAVLPHAKASFKISSNNTGPDITWWSSTVWVSKERPSKPYFLMLRHTLYSLELAIEKNTCLQIISDHSGLVTGILGTEHFPLPRIEEACSLADAMPKELVDRFLDKMKQGLAPPEPVMIYDLVLVPCHWNLAKATLQQAKSNFGNALGHTLHMRAVDHINPARNGVTTGLVPSTDSNRKLVKSCGVVMHQIANSFGGSGSFAWEGEAACLMHVGTRGEGLNYGIPGPVLKQLERRWLGQEPIPSTDKGYKRFLADVRKQASACDVLITAVPPELVDNRASDALANAICAPFHTPLFEGVGLLPKGQGDLGRKQYRAGDHLKALAKKDYGMARSYVKRFKVATNASSPIMAMLYYWMDKFPEEEYDYRWTRSEVEDEELEDLRREAEESFKDWVFNMIHGESLSAFADSLLGGSDGPEVSSAALTESLPSPPPDATASTPRRIELTTEQWEAVATQFASAPAPPEQAPAAAEQSSSQPAVLHSIRHFAVPRGEQQAFMNPWPKRALLESPARDFTITQVPPEEMQAALPAVPYTCLVDECRKLADVDSDGCDAFDKLCLHFLRDPECLNTMTMTELYQKCEGYNFRGSLRNSAHWALYIGPNVVPEDKAHGAARIKHATAKAKVAFSGRPKNMKEPSFDGLHAAFPHWNWDFPNNQARGVMPPTGPQDIADSLNAQLKDRSGLLGFDPRTVPALAEGYPAHVWEGDETIRACIRRHFEALALEKGVGWHLRPGIKTKRDYVECIESTPATIVKLLLLLTTSVDLTTHTAPWDLYQAGLIMPEVLKIKNEAHSRAKADLKRWRLIWQTCITQEVLARLIQGDQNQAEIGAYQVGYTHSEDFPTFGNAAGMGHDDKSLEDTCDALRRLLGEDAGCAADRKAWDMSITRHGWMADGHLRAILARAGGAPPKFVEAQFKLCALLSAHVVQVGKYLYQIDIFGIVGSGILSTASSNGHINQIVTLDFGVSQLDPMILVVYELIRPFLSLVMGDDSVMRTCPLDVDAFIAHHARRGIEVTGAEKNTKPSPISDLTKIPLTSHDYNLTPGAYPAAVFTNVEKLSWRLASKLAVIREQALGVLFAVRHSPHLAEVREMIIRVNPELACLKYVEGVAYSLMTFL